MSLKWPYSEATSGPPQEAPPQVQGTSLILSHPQVLTCPGPLRHSQTRLYKLSHTLL